MELFTKLFGDVVTFVYHGFDRIVIHGYVTRLCRPEHVVYFFQEVVGVPAITKEILRQRTNAYQSWVEAFARNHKIPIQWPEKRTRRFHHRPDPNIAPTAISKPLIIAPITPFSASSNSSLPPDPLDIKDRRPRNARR
jgi:hypothetical protein